ncbi:MAG: hypothetical protein U1F24_09900 [Alphaproteobacteria bacterium]
MKSSLAQTFKDAAEGTKRTEFSQADQQPVKSLTIPGRQLGAIRSWICAALRRAVRANRKDLRCSWCKTSRYAKLHVGIDDAKAKFLKALKAKADSKADFEKQIGDAFTSGDGLEIALHRIQTELAKQADAPFADVPYDTIFNDRVIAALNTKGLKDAVEDYIKRYNQLISSSTYFKKGTFEYFNASQIAKSLTDNGFFNANHTVTLKSSGETLKLTTSKSWKK